MIFQDSRYEEEDFVYDTENEVFRLPIRRNSYDKSNYSTTIYHIWMRGDTITNLANEYYGNPRLFWIILDANPILKGDPTNAVPGMTLVIPQEVV